MDWAHLDRLWLLVVVPLLWWLARPPRPRQEVATPHLAQWRAALARARRAPVRFRRLRFVLLVLAVCALIFASTDPRLGARQGPNRLLVVVDGSASMAATGSWAAAQQAVRTAVAATPAHVAVRGLVVGARVTPFDPRARDEVEAGHRALASEAPRDEGAALSIAAVVDSFADPEELQVLVVSDALGPAARFLGPAHALAVVGVDRENAALIDVSVEDAWPLEAITVEGAVRGFGAVADTRVVLRRRSPAPPDAAPSAWSQIAETQVRPTAAGTAFAFTFERGPRGGRIELRLEPASEAGAPDALELDDVVTFDLPDPPAPDVAVLADAESGPWVDQVADALVALGGGQRVDAGAGERAGFVVVDGGRIAALPRRGLVFGTAVGEATGATGPGAGRDSLTAPVLGQWDRGDPLLAGVDLSELRIDRARSDLPPGQPLLLSTAGVPLAVAVERPRPGTGPAPNIERTLVFGFRLADSNLPLLPALPQILLRAYRAAWGEAAEPRQVGPGLPDPAESDLRAASGGRAGDVALGPFGAPGTSLVVPLLLLALLALAARLLT